jgi:polyisoprenoid-binding protein YceI
MPTFQLFLAASSITLALACAPTGDAPRAMADTITTSSGAVSPELRASELPAGAVRFVVATSGNEVRYRVREQLAGFDFPNYAVGKSTAVTGAIAIDDAGKILADGSRFVIDAATFTSDRERRDGYVQNRLLQAAEYPTVTFVPTEARGVSLPPAAAGSSTFDLVGDLTVRGVTRPTTWRVTATVAGDQVSGSAMTRFAFTHFQMEKPRVRSVLTVADTIALEYDFRLVRDSPTP